MTFLIANSNPIHEAMIERLGEDYDFRTVRTPEELLAATDGRTYDYIFFPHWSFIIPASIYERNECVLFHMTDLPYGRGGSPLQNLIVRGHEKTMLTAIRVAKGLDTGPVYAKRELSLLGTAREIFLRTSDLMYGLITLTLRTRPTPTPQEGEPTLFKRRKPADGDLAPLNTLTAAYDHIRMLDADGYPPAFVETEHLRFEFTRAGRHADQLLADVRITKK